MGRYLGNQRIRTGLLVNWQLLPEVELSPAGYPLMQPVDMPADDSATLARFKDALTCEFPQSQGLQFFQDDYQFERVWAQPEKYLSIAGALNIGLNLFFVIVCQLNVMGVALASAISQCVSAGLILRALTKVQDCYALDLHAIKLDLGMTKRILLLGVPAGFQNAVFAIANLFIQAGVNSFDSLMVKGNSAAANADAMIYDAMAAFYMACASFMSQNYGAGKVDRVKKSYFISLAYGFGVGLVLGGGLLLFGRQFLALFTTEPDVIDAGMKRIMVMGLAYCISSPYRFCCAE